MHGPEMLIPIAFFAAVFGIFYIRSRENMAMIERGMNPRTMVRKGPGPFSTLRFALLSMGIGFGALLAMLLIPFLPDQVRVIGTERFTESHDELYPALMAVFGGLGLLISYRIERKEWDRDQQLAQPARRDAVEEEVL